MQTVFETTEKVVDNKTMQAAVLHGAKDIRIESIPQPELSPGMVLLRIKRAGICGSDMHYYADGYCGSFVPSKPFVLGHELTAEVVAVNDDNTTALKFPAIGARVTVNPARACGVCNYCTIGRQNLCSSTIMLGSGSTNPPTNGAMAQYVSVRADQCFVLPDTIDDGGGAMIEPLAVALQGVKQAGVIKGKKILVTGGGVIGLLTAITVKNFGAALVAVSDIVEERRNTAMKFNVDAVLNPVDNQMPQLVNELTGDGFDIIFEASGARQAVRQAFDLVSPGGTIVQIGTIGTEDVPLPANLLMVKEIKFIGSFRYANIFEEAIQLVASGKIDLKNFITKVFPLNEVASAFSLSADKSTALKIQIEI